MLLLHCPIQLLKLSHHICISVSPKEEEVKMAYSPFKIVLGGLEAQVVEYLPSKCEALSSNPSTTKKKKKKKIVPGSGTKHFCLHAIGQHLVT
jgi:hypothetical protein